MKTYLIIGASSGIGKKIAETLSESGHKIYATYFTHLPQSTSERIEYFYLNVLGPEPDFGFLPDRLDGLVYCPGNILLKPFSRIEPEEFINDYRLQVLGAIKAIQSLLPRLKNGENSSILFFSTVAVQSGFRFHSLISSSKGAVEGLVKALAAELAPEIRVNAIAPSLTDTPLSSKLLDSIEKREANANRHPLKRIGNTSDIAYLAEYLLSDKAGWITGQIIHVDGGISSIKL